MIASKQIRTEKNRKQSIAILYIKGHRTITVTSLSDV